jgi:hypothetical protein
VFRIFGFLKKFAIRANISCSLNEDSSDQTPLPTEFLPLRTKVKPLATSHFTLASSSSSSPGRDFGGIACSLAADHWDEAGRGAAGGSRSANKDAFVLNKANIAASLGGGRGVHAGHDHAPRTGGGNDGDDSIAH